jgi:glycosyltransferase involved in cell wall biosynthesis
VEAVSGPPPNEHYVRRGPFKISPTTRQRLWDSVARINADLLHVEMDYAAAMLGLPGYPTRLPLVLDSGCTYHLSYLREARWARSPLDRARALVRWFRLRRYESRLAAAMDTILAVSQKEAEILARLCPTVRTVVVPNGVDCESFPYQPLGGDVLFCGSLAWPPNYDAVLFFLERILPRVRAKGCDASVLIVGVGVDEEVRRLAAADGRVLLPGHVPEMAPWLARARVVINPMRGGGGTRLKVLEGMASGRPIVSTQIGSEGLEVTDGREVLLKDDPAAFADAVCNLLRNQELAAAMGRAGRALVERSYDWRVCLAPLGPLYDELAGARQSTS